MHKATELFEQAVAILEDLSNRPDQAKTLYLLGRCLSRHGQHDRALDCCGGISSGCADTLQDAETWLRTGLDLTRMYTQMQLACVVFLKGEIDEAVEMLSKHLQGWVDDGRHCALGACRCEGRTLRC